MTVDSLLEEAFKKISSTSSEHNKALLKQLSAHIPEDDLDHFTPDLLAELIQVHNDLSKKRDTGAPKLKIYSYKTDKHAPPRTIIDIVSDDFAFIVDSVVAEINKHNLLIDLLMHPILYSKYNKNGELEDVSALAAEGYIQQSHLHVQVKNNLTEDMMKSLEEGLYSILKDVEITNRDWIKLLEELKTARDDLAQAKTRRPNKEIKKYCEFLDYLIDNNFTLLGYREYKFMEKDGFVFSETVKNSSLGLLHNSKRPAYINDSDECLPRNLQEKRRSLPSISVSKTNRTSTVHRRVPMDAVAIKTYDENGNVTGEKLFLGLFTSVTYSRSVSDVPYLREKVDEVIEMSGSIPRSHNRKALRHILEKYPRDELFQITPKQLLRICTNILRLQERQRVALFMRKDQFRRYISCLVYIPRDRFGTSLREKMAGILEKELNGELATFYTSVDDSGFARVMFVINVNQRTENKYNAEAIEKKLQDAAETWEEKLSWALSKAYDDQETAKSHTHKYGDAFPIAYTSRYRASQAVFDIRKIEAVIETSLLQPDLYHSDELSDNQLRLKVYNPDTPLTLSDIMPILDHLGLRAISELPFEIKPSGADRSVWIHDFLLETPLNKPRISMQEVKANFEIGLSKIWEQDMESDGLNHLILFANMNWREISILRTYVRYLKQIRFPLSRPYVEKTLNAHPKIGRMIIDLFNGLFDPENLMSEKEMDAHREALEEKLQAVESLDHDRVLRMLVALIEATLRTNFFQKDKNGEVKNYISVKFDCSKIPGLPEPRPYREIFVYSRQVEGVHLRGDKIARGGLRWSDRHDDFRTEVLGLMKAQMVKNSVIVPMGAKGGFVVKAPSSDRKIFREQGLECYKIFIRGMLDITDNQKGGKVIPPKDVVRRDSDDPYLVVAADKGTATFSDIANTLSQEYDFWLDDAFASGGSAGYDHKKMGITAKGAWESVKLHFRELDHDTQSADFNVIGVGDMGGDVFGNGMLLSENIRLIAAFNHLHIFVDPSPDAATSYKERKRLFDDMLGWDEYDSSKLSKGGRIFERTEKNLKLTPEIKARFDISKDAVTPNELMRAILKARTDLLWFGGIGTYIKSSSETNEDAGDKANDTIRLNAKEIRAKVVGEGANLGVTQLGRIEFSKNGGHINTDFIDNSGGVNSSDLEVNIKILLSDVMSSKNNDMDLKARNKLLSKMTDEVSALVLRNNYQQAQAISLAAFDAKNNLQAHNDFIRQLEREHGLNRTLEGLPDEEEIDRRLRAGDGLTRPELSVLVSYSKIGFMQSLMKSDIPDSNEMDEWLVDYFPKDLHDKYDKQIRRHRLAREIISTQMANSLINRMGPTFLKEKMVKTGAKINQIAKAYIIVRDAFNLRDLWDDIEALDNKVPAEVQIKAMREISSLAEHNISWFLTRITGELNIGREIMDYSHSISDLRKKLPKVLPPEQMELVEHRTERGIADGLPKNLAQQIALLPVLSSACDIIMITQETETDLYETAKTYFGIGQHFHMDWMRRQARFLPMTTPWQYEAANGLIDQLFRSQSTLTVKILRDVNTKNAPKNGFINAWLDTHEGQMQKIMPLFSTLRRAGTLDLSMLLTAEQRLTNMANN
ncbi:MAG: NAD-glutamate dehydrogenase [Micavibrio sp.]|nr:NAD-glutamate dehydrogenase [Micavibrio sp.]